MADGYRMKPTGGRKAKGRRGPGGIQRRTAPDAAYLTNRGKRGPGLFAKDKRPTRGESGLCGAHCQGAGRPDPGGTTKTFASPGQLPPAGQTGRRERNQAPALIHPPLNQMRFKSNSSADDSTGEAARFGTMAGGMRRGGSLASGTRWRPPWRTSKHGRTWQIMGGIGKPWAISSKHGPPPKIGRNRQTFDLVNYRQDRFGGPTGFPCSPPWRAAHRESQQNQDRRNGAGG